MIAREGEHFFIEVFQCFLIEIYEMNELDLSEAETNSDENTISLIMIK